jgi:putative flippase GtrA
VVVGGCGFASDVIVFQLLLMLDGGLVVSRLVSAGVAITITWLMNRVFTFQTSRDPFPGLEYLRYVLVQMAGLILNIGCYLILVLRVDYFEANPLLALFAGASLAIVSNFLGSKIWVFRSRDNSTG